jgi:hypothetical protein
VAYFRTDNVLYFGCRSAREDYYYSGEWEAAAQAGKLSFSVAFSRDQVGIFNTLRIEILISLPGQESVRPRFDRARFVQSLGSGGEAKGLGLHFRVSGNDLMFLMCSFLEQVVQQDAGCRQGGDKEGGGIRRRLIRRRGYEIPLSNGVGRPSLRRMLELTNLCSCDLLLSWYSADLRLIFDVLEVESLTDLHLSMGDLKYSTWAPSLFEVVTLVNIRNETRENTRKPEWQSPVLPHTEKRKLHCLDLPDNPPYRTDQKDTLRLLTKAQHQNQPETEHTTSKGDRWKRETDIESC